MKAVNASHILVKTEKEANDLLEKIKAGDLSFEDAARKFSFCPSKRDGGKLGTFERGMMVPEFDAACFDSKNKSGDIKGPVKTQFGFHLIKINGVI
jgi:peptidyl-prolyl cis-trans isomerase C